MKRIVLMAVALIFILSGIAGGAMLYLSWQPSEPQAPLEAHLGHMNAPPAERTEAETVVRNRTLLLVEDLGAAQDRIIRGDRAALADQAQLLSEIAGAIRRFGPEDWNDYVNLRASFVYVLSGGDPKVLKPFVDSDDSNESDRSLARGIMSFGLGEAKAARRAFEGVDPRSLDVSLVGPFALARASLYIDKDAVKAITYLDEARLASPHTAIEEAAARREIPILMNTGDAPRALKLTTDYVRRYGKSIYAWKLFYDLAEAIAKRDEFNDSAMANGLLGAIDGGDDDVNTALLLNISGTALLRGKLTLAKMTAAKVLSIGSGSAEDLEKARLYEAAANAPSEDAVGALKVLSGIPPDQLSDDDVQIKGAADYVARVVAGLEMGTPPRKERKKESPPTGEATMPALPKVSGALDAADAALKEADLMNAGNTR